MGGTCVEGYTGDCPEPGKEKKLGCHTLNVWAASYLSYPVDRDPCYQFKWSLGKCYFKNLNKQT